MGLFQRLFTFSLGGKSKNNQKKKNSGEPVLHASQSVNNLLTTTHPNRDQQAAVNRLLRSSSTHFSILSETDYHSLPPIPHPINNLLREPSIISTQTTNTVNTYTVTVHTRTVHSRTEFPNANGTTSLLSSPTNSPGKTSHPLLPPLTPGDRSRLENLRQDPSVLSLLNIFDEAGHPNPKAFANTPARQRRVSTFKMLLGEQGTIEEGSMECKESDLSWAERYLQQAQRGSPSSSIHSSLGMTDDLFKDDLLDIRDSEDPNTSMTSQSHSIVDSLEVELGTAEDGSMVLHPSKLVPNRESLLQFFLDEDKHEEIKAESFSLQPVSLKLSTALQAVPQAPRGPRAMGESEPVPIPRLTMRNGPQLKHAQLSPPPKKHQPPPLPLIPPDFQFRSSHPLKVNPLGYRAPFGGLPNNGSSLGIIPSGTTDRAVSVASSVYPQIETMPPPLPPLPPLPSQTETDCDPYTPIPRRPVDGNRKSKHVFIPDENVPPGAPLRPTKIMVKRLFKELDRDQRNGKLVTTLSPDEISREVKVEARDTVKGNENFAHRTPKKSSIFRLQVLERPSPASSSELSPEGRRIMDTVRAQARSPRRTPQKWHPLVDNLNVMTTVLG